MKRKSHFITGSPGGVLNITYISMVAAIMCITAPFSIPLPVSPVPVTLATLVIFLGVYIIGYKGTLISLLIYLLLGIAGLPVFSGFSGGIGKVAGPTGGYLLGYLLMAVIAGFCIERSSGRLPISLAGMAAATIADYLIGTVWLFVQMDSTFTAALSVGVLPYLPGDIVKIAVAAIAGPALKKRLSRLGTGYF